jgi:hypothetical protein
MNKRHIPTEDKQFVKDLRSGAFLNIDTTGYESYKRERERLLRQQQLENKVTDLQRDMEDIKQLLRQLINGNTNGKSNI